MIKVFDKSADSLPQEEREKVFFENMPADEAIEEGQCSESDVLIVDPPRKGLGRGVMDLLIGKHPTQTASNLKRLIYVSCGFDALERYVPLCLSSFNTPFSHDNNDPLLSSFFVLGIARNFCRLDHGRLPPQTVFSSFLEVIMSKLLLFLTKYDFYDFI